MTAQVHDRVVWEGRDCLLVGIDGTGLFDPWEHGLRTQPTTTANWRGCVAHYGVRDDRLLLLELTDVGLAIEPGRPPPSLRGTLPQGERGFAYPDLNWPLDFTGRLLIGRGFIQALYRHMGFHPAWKFEESWELVFDGGRLTSARDTSDEMRARRAKIKAGREEDPDGPHRPGWIVRTFRLDFWRSRGRSR